MRSRILYLCLLLLPLAACGQVPTPGEGAFAYPPPPTQAVLPSPPPDETRPPSDAVPVVCVDQPLRYGPCVPTPSDAERAAVLAQGFPVTLTFELQRAIYLWEQRGFPSRPADILVQFDPDILTITAAVALAGQHGVKVWFQYERRSFFDGTVALDAVPALATERGIAKVSLVADIPLDPFPCPTPSGRTAVPITCGPEFERP